MTSETAAIEKTLWTYLDGLHEGDADKIASGVPSRVASLFRDRTAMSPTCRATNGSTWCAAGRRRSRKASRATTAS